MGGPKTAGKRPKIESIRGLVDCGRGSASDQPADADLVWPWGRSEIDIDVVVA
ncbi:hypothetical protein ES702_06472 [subsurface metagenome]